MSQSRILAHIHHPSSTVKSISTDQTLFRTAIKSLEEALSDHAKAYPTEIFVKQTRFFLHAAILYGSKDADTVIHQLDSSKKNSLAQALALGKFLQSDVRENEEQEFEELIKNEEGLKLIDEVELNHVPSMR